MAAKALPAVLISAESRVPAPPTALKVSTKPKLGGSSRGGINGKRAKQARLMPVIQAKALRQGRYLAGARHSSHTNAATGSTKWMVV